MMDVRDIASELRNRGLCARQNRDNKLFFVTLAGPRLRLDRGLVLIHSNRNLIFALCP